LFEPGEDRETAAGQCADHHFVTWPQIFDDAPRCVPQHSRDPMTLHRRADGLGDNETNLRRAGVDVRGLQRMHDEVGLRCSYATTDGYPKVGRPRHPVLSRKHWSYTLLKTRRITQ
jgi:hypothetical protein